MRRGTIPLGRLFGIPIGLDYSWFLIFVLLTWSLATSYFPARFSGWSAELYWSLGALTTVILFVSVLLHELGHALTAMAFRIPVRRIRLMIFGGVAEMGDESPNAGAEFAVAIAGPVVSLLVAAAAGAGWLALRSAGVFAPAMAVLGYMGLANAMLAGFNMIPGFPLDGGRVLRAVLWGATQNMGRATRIAGNIGRIIGFGFIGLGLVEVFLLGNLTNGLWTGFIGMFLQGAASAEMQAQHIRDMLAGRTVSQVMNPNFTTLPGYLTVQQVIDAHILGSGRRVFVVTDGDRVLGLLSLSSVSKLPIEARAVTPVSEVMLPLDRIGAVAPDTELWAALRRMEAEQLGVLPVLENGHFRGMLRREDVFSFVRTLNMLGSQYVRS